MNDYSLHLGFLERCEVLFTTDRQLDELRDHRAWSTVRELTCNEPTLPLSAAFRSLEKLDGLTQTSLALLCANEGELPLKHLGFRVDTLPPNEVGQLEAASLRLPELQQVSVLLMLYCRPYSADWQHWSWLPRTPSLKAARQLEVAIKTELTREQLRDWRQVFDALPELEALTFHGAKLATTLRRGARAAKTSESAWERLFERQRKLLHRQLEADGKRKRARQLARKKAQSAVAPTTQVEERSVAPEARIAHPLAEPPPRPRRQNFTASSSRIAFSPDQRTLAFALGTGELALIDARGKRKKRGASYVATDTWHLTATAFHPTSGVLVFNRHGLLVAWDRDRHEPVSVVKEHGNPFRVLRASASRLLSFDERHVCLWQHLDHSERVINLRSWSKDATLSPQGAWVALVNEASELRVLEVEGKGRQQPLKNAPRSAELVAIPNEQHVVSAHRSGELHLWNLQERTLVHTIEADWPVDYLEPLPHDRVAAANSKTGEVVVYRGDLSERLLTLQAGEKLSSLAPSHDGRQLAVARRYDVSVYDLKQGKELWSWERPNLTG